MIIKEEYTKKEIEDMILKKMKSSELKDTIEDICQSTIKTLFRDLWQRSTFWTKH